MIQNYTDHAANERTFLAWVRTAIAVMAFGFLVARFNLFMRIAAQSLAISGKRPPMVPASSLGNLAGLMLIVAGTVIIGVATMRFIRTGRAIDSPSRHFSSIRADLLLAALIVVLGLALLLYLSDALTGTL